MQGYNPPKNVGTLVASLSGRQDELDEWNQDKIIGHARPATPDPEENFTGNAEWNERIRKAIRFHSGRILPKFVDSPIASSDDLLKDYNKLKERLEIDRRILVAEMEAAGVAKACNRHDGQFPFLPIRCISDIVGVRRDPRWTQYACEVAASFTAAFVNLGFLSNDTRSRRGSSSPVESSEVAQLRGIFEHLVAPFPLEILTKLFGTSTANLHRCLDDLIASQVLTVVPGF
jgi:Phosphorylase superfamily